jgi:hypothetical protein
MRKRRNRIRRYGWSTDRKHRHRLVCGRIPQTVVDMILATMHAWAQIRSPLVAYCQEGEDGLERARQENKTLTNEMRAKIAAIKRRH